MQDDTTPSIEIPVYVYALVDSTTGDIRYIGISQNPEQRLRQHILNASRGERTYKANWIRHLLDNSNEPELHILETCNSRKSAAVAEIQWIAYGRGEKWPITNQTDGGDGSVGHVVSAEARERLSSLARGRPAWNRGKPPSPEVRAKLSQALRGRKLTDETKAKISAATRGKRKSAETRAKMSANNGMKRPEVRAKVSGDNSSMKRPEVRAKFSGDNNPMRKPENAEKHRAALKSPDVIAKRRAAMANPETRQKIAAARHKQVMKPQSAETKAKKSAALKAYWKRHREEQEGYDQLPLL
jgi:predicted GIY-YIG superfamily endonuclease